MPRTGDAQLLGAVLGGHAGDRMRGVVGEAAAEPVGLRPGSGCDASSGALRLHPHRRIAPPVGEGADAVPRREHLVEPRDQLRYRHAFVDGLRDVEGRHDIDGQLGHHAQRPEADHGAVEVRRGAPLQLDDVTAGPDKLHRSHQRGEALVLGRPSHASRWRMHRPARCAGATAAPSGRTPQRAAGPRGPPGACPPGRSPCARPRSIRTSAGNSSRTTRSPSVSASRLKECPVPSTRTDARRGHDPLEFLERGRDGGCGRG